jgi:hypothetical protein
MSVFLYPALTENIVVLLLLDYFIEGVWLDRPPGVIALTLLGAEFIWVVGGGVVLLGHLREFC